MKPAKILKMCSLLPFILVHACAPVTAATMQEPSGMPATATPASGAALPMFRGNPGHTGLYKAPPIHKLAGVKWKFKAGGYITSSPALENGLLYFGSQDGNLYALDIKTGAEAWSFQTGKPVNSSPAVSNGLIFFQSNNGFTYALDSKSGKQRWKVDTGPDRTTDYDFLSSSPVVQSNIVYVAGGNGSLYALDANTGDQFWAVPTTGLYSLPVRSSPAVAGGTVYFTTQNSLLALDRKTGKQKWLYGPNTVARSSPTIGDGIVVFGDNSSSIYALDSETGAEKWKYRIKYYWVVSTAAIADDVVYIGGDDSYLNALDAKTGNEKWRFKTKGETVWSSPAIVDGVIYFGDWNFSGVKDESGNSLWGFLYAVDAKTGHELWSFKTGGNIVSSPVVGADGVVYFGSLDGYLYALYGYN